MRSSNSGLIWRIATGVPVAASVLIVSLASLSGEKALRVQWSSDSA